MLALNLILCALLAGEPVGGDPTAPNPWPVEPAGSMMRDISPQRLAGTIEDLESFGTRHTLSRDEPGRGIAQAREYLRTRFEHIARETGRPISIGYQVFRPLFAADPAARDRDMVNIIVALPGRGVDLQPTGDPLSDSKNLIARLPSLRRVCLIAHYDTPGEIAGPAPGALDNASGVAAVLEIARALASSPPLDHSVVLVLSDGSSFGQLGAEFLVSVIHGHGEQIVGVIDLDTIGFAGASGRPRRVRLWSEGLPHQLEPRHLERLRAIGAESESASRELARYIHSAALAHELPVRPELILRQDRLGERSDHVPYNTDGFPAVRLMGEEPSPDARGAGDRSGRVDADYLADITRLAGFSVVHLARAPGMPVDARLSLRSPRGTSLLRWRAPLEGGEEPAGYEVVYRPTTAWAWQGAVDVGSVHQATLPLDRDELILGVRSYNRDGERSPAAVVLLEER